MRFYSENIAPEVVSGSGTRAACAWSSPLSSASMAAIGVHFGYTCACVAIFKVSLHSVYLYWPSPPCPPSSGSHWLISSSYAD